MVFKFFRQQNEAKKRRLLAEKILDSLNQDQKEEVQDFSRFCQLQSEKISFMRSIHADYKGNWKKAKHFVKESLPRLVERQIHILEKECHIIKEENYLMKKLMHSDEGIIDITTGLNPNEQQMAVHLLKQDHNELKETILVNKKKIQSELNRMIILLMDEFPRFALSTGWSSLKDDKSSNYQEQERTVESLVKLISSTTSQIKEILKNELSQMALQQKVLETERAAEQSKNHFLSLPAKYVLVIGCSMGGAEAVSYLLKYVRHESSAVILVPHIDESTIYESLQNNHKLGGLYLGNSIQRNVIYCWAYKKMNITYRGFQIVNNKITDMPHKDDFKYPTSHILDFMMHYCAKGFGNRCIGIILSGSGNDGALGVREIKKYGGRVLVNIEDTSNPTYPTKSHNNEMSKSALSSISVDFRGTMPQLIQRLNSIL